MERLRRTMLFVPGGNERFLTKALGLNVDCLILDLEDSVGLDRKASAREAVTGVPLAASCRFSAIGKSPLTETAGESEAAGFFGPELKMAGFDAIVFRGKAESPVYLWVTDGKAEIKDASHLADLGAREVEDAIRSDRGSRKIRVAQAGESSSNWVWNGSMSCSRPCRQPCWCHGCDR